MVFRKQIILIFATLLGKKAGIAQLVEHDLAKVGVASSSLVSRSFQSSVGSQQSTVM